MPQKRILPATNQERLAWAVAGAARHGYDASVPRLEELFKTGRLAFTPTGVFTPRPATPEMCRIAELLTRAGVRSLSVTE